MTGSSNADVPIDAERSPARTITKRCELDHIQVRFAKRKIMLKGWSPKVLVGASGLPSARARARGRAAIAGVVAGIGLLACNPERAAVAPGASWLAGATATIAEAAPAPLAAGYVRLRLRDPEARDVGGRPAWHTVVNRGQRHPPHGR
jgi:hypothetical protein